MEEDKNKEEQLGKRTRTGGKNQDSWEVEKNAGEQTGKTRRTGGNNKVNWEEKMMREQLGEWGKTVLPFILSGGVFPVSHFHHVSVEVTFYWTFPRFPQVSKRNLACLEFCACVPAPVVEWRGWRSRVMCGLDDSPSLDVRTPVMTVP